MKRELDLPLGPSVNGMFPGRTRRRKSNAYVVWIQAAGWEINIQKPKPLGPGRYEVAIQVPEKMRGDADNRIKAVLDLLVSRGLTPDDDKADCSVKRSADVPAGRCHVQFWTIEPVAADG
ncbi:MAG: hypothetical protein AAFW60_02860 [Pseudomonadota bacterium]